MQADAYAVLSLLSPVWEAECDGGHDDDGQKVSKC